MINSARFKLFLADSLRVIGSLFAIYLTYALFLKTIWGENAGKIGGLLSDVTIRIFGQGASFVVLAAFISFLFYFSKKYHWYQVLKYWLGVLIFVTGINIPIAYIYGADPQQAFLFAGLIGNFFVLEEGLDLQTYLGVVGSYLFSAALLIIGVLMMFDLTTDDGMKVLKKVFTGMSAPSPEKKEKKNKGNIFLPKKKKKKNNTFSRNESNAEPVVAETVPVAEGGVEVTTYRLGEYERKGTLTRQKSMYPYPPLQLLSDPPEEMKSLTNEDIKRTSELIENIFSDHKVDVNVIRVNQGPVVTCYEIKPAEGTKIAKILNLHQELALALKKENVRIVAPLENKGTIGLEIPNGFRNVVTFKEILGSDEFKKKKGNLRIALGKTIDGSPTSTDLTQMPHLLIAGRTGSGKSVCVNSIICSLLYTCPPEEVQMLMIDPKRVELGVYNDIPHLLAPVVFEASKAAKALEWVMNIMIERNELFSALNLRNIVKYNKAVRSGRIKYDKDNNLLQPMPYIVVIIDELADLMMMGKKEVEFYIQRLSQMGRSVGIHLIVATQRPSVDVITGLIKANIPSRIAFQVSSKIDSRTILDQMGAESLIGNGDMLLYSPGLNKPMRIQGTFISDEEVEKTVNHLKPYTSAMTLTEESIDFNTLEDDDTTSGTDQGAMEEDPLFEEAAKLVFDHNVASISMLQRSLNIGFNRAGRLMLMLEKYGVCGPSQGSKPRKILMSKEEFYERFSS